MAAHKHAELMMEYAKDAMETESKANKSQKYYEFVSINGQLDY